MHEIDLGNGIMVYEDAVSSEHINVARDLALTAVERERSGMYVEALDPETGRPVYKNRNGYVFRHDSVSLMPERASSIHNTAEHREVWDELERIRDACLFHYFERYPLAYNTVWWKIKGHIVRYGPGAFLGAHSDTQAEYVHGIHKATTEIALRVTITALIYLNSSGTDYTGGEHYFPYLSTSISPRAGSVVLFPTNYVAAHEVRPVESGIRLSYLGWYGQGTPNPAAGEDVVDPSIDSDRALLATNIYLPTLRDDYRSFLIDRGYDHSSEQWRVTEISIDRELV